MTKPERLLQLLTLLRSRRTAITANELADRLGVSERTIYRDIQSLELSGVSISGEAGVGYQLQAKSSIPPLMFTEAEIESLMLGIRLVNGWMDDELGASANSALDKIKAALPEKMLQDLDHRTTKFVVPEFYKYERAKFAKDIRAAIEGRHPIQLIYEDEKKQASERVVYPLGLIYWGATWTLACWCTLRSDYRSFRLDRMQSIAIQAQTFAQKYTLKSFLAHYDTDVHVGFWRS